jgi:putative NADH-flavin reductase
MKIAIIGASGQTGTELIRQARKHGHEIIGVARTPENIFPSDPDIIRRKGDAFDRQTIVDGVAGADVVITTIGKRNLLDKRYTLNTEGHRNVIAAMRAHGISRMLPISSFGAARGVVRKGVRRKIYLFLRRKYYGDMNAMEQEVLASGLNVTVVRAPMLHNRAAEHRYSVVEGNILPSGLNISRADLAHFIIGQIDSDEYLNKIVALADDPVS